MKRAVSGRVALLFGAAGVIVVACTDIPTSDTAVLSVGVNPLMTNSVVLNDTLRDTAGKAVPLGATVYNFNGNVVSGAPVRFFAVDRGISVDSVKGFVVGDSLRDTPARVAVNVGSLQAFQPILVTLRPDTVFGVNARDSLSYNTLDSTKNVSPALSIRVQHTLTSADSVVKNYLVSFTVTSTSDTLLARLVNDANASSRFDTTDASGNASRKIKLNPARLTNLNDSIIIAASVKYRGVNVKGSPVRLVLKVKAPGT